jgi:hypothetical protein
MRRTQFVAVIAQKIQNNMTDLDLKKKNQTKKKIPEIKIDAKKEEQKIVSYIICWRENL